MATAAVCGTKRSYFYEDEIDRLPKRIRCISPVRIPQPPKENSAAQSPIPANGEQWVELLVKEMMNAASMDDAKARAGRVLEMLRKAISDHVGEEAAKNFERRNSEMEERVEVLTKENGVLKRAVAIQHERLKQEEDKEKELQQCKEIVVHYREKVRTLEVDNYALRMHLNQALQGGNSLGGRCNPDVY